MTTDELLTAPDHYDRSDPTLAAIRRWEAVDHRTTTAQALFREFERVYFATRAPRAEEDEAYTAAWESVSAEVQSAHAALGAALRTRPTTLRGAIGLLRTVVGFDDGSLEHDDLPTALSNLLAFLERLEDVTATDRGGKIGES